MTPEKAKQKDLVNFLAELGYKPVRIRNNDYWYISPLRIERTASFKINRHKNVWFDHGLGKGGTLIDFGILYFSCTVREFLTKLGPDEMRETPFLNTPKIHPSKKEVEKLASKIIVTETAEITDPGLIHYLSSRKIPVDIARRYCKQICFEMNGRKQLAIGFPNLAGGYELRNKYFKGSSSPKQAALVKDKESSELVVFEGFFSFLSYSTLLKINHQQKRELPESQPEILVLNSLSFFEKNRGLMEKYQRVHLCLDRDKMGEQCTKKALEWSPVFRDQSGFYHPFKDLNEYLKNNKINEQKPGHTKGKSL